MTNDAQQAGARRMDDRAGSGGCVRLPGETIDASSRRAREPGRRISDTVGAVPRRPRSVRGGRPCGRAGWAGSDGHALGCVEWPRPGGVTRAGPDSGAGNRDQVRCGGGCGEGLAGGAGEGEVVVLDDGCFGGGGGALGGDGELAGDGDLVVHDLVPAGGVDGGGGGEAVAG